MITADQSAVVEFLGASPTHGGAPVERIDTHTAVVFLAGARAWKLKRAVRFDYLDFSTLDRRKACCEAEVRLNQRTAPSIYLGVVAVTRETGGTLTLGGEGTPVEWLVAMNRFDQAALLDRMAAGGTLGLELMPPLGAAIAAFHHDAEPRANHGGAAGMRAVAEGNAAGFGDVGAGVLDPAACARLTAATLGAIAQHARLLDDRRDAGCVRQCHGDLHLRNIVLLDGRPTLFDAIEFNDALACIDVLYDLAFLLMDLWRRQLPRHANVVWNVYLATARDIAGLPLLPLFLSLRAAVRAKTSATAARVQPEAAAARELQQLAREYLALAERLLEPRGPRLVAIGGLSGTGKSTLAAALAPRLGSPPGAVVLRSDEIRKRMCGVDPQQRLGAAGYTAGVSAQVYAALAEQARAVVSGGSSVIADAVYGTPLQRLAIEHAAAAAGVPFAGFWLDAPESALVPRVAQRRGDASDADAAVVRLQQARDTGVITWQRVDASGSADAVLHDVAARVGE